LKREPIADAGIEESAFGIGFEQILINTQRDIRITIDIATGEHDVKSLRIREVFGRCQNG